MYPYHSAVRPLNKIIHINGPHNAGETIQFDHQISGNTSNLHPLLLIAGDETTELGRGAAIETVDPVMNQTEGDSGSADLDLVDSTVDRRDYIVQFGYSTELLAGGGQYTYQVPITNQNYLTTTLDIARSPAIIHHSIGDCRRWGEWQQ